MSASQLQCFNDALTIIGERILSSTTEAREPARVLNQVWDAGAVDYCLERGQWNFAMHSIKLEYSPSVEPTWGYKRAFDKPIDYIRTAALCSDEYFLEPLNYYVDEANFWFADLDILYIRYVSNDASYGMDMGKWPPTFTEFVGAYLAFKGARRLTQSQDKRDDAAKEFNRCLMEAKSNDAMNEPTGQLPRGSWTRARTAGYNRNDRGNRNSLIG